MIGRIWRDLARLVLAWSVPVLELIAWLAWSVPLAVTGAAVAMIAMHLRGRSR